MCMVVLLCGGCMHVVCSSMWSWQLYIYIYMYVVTVGGCRYVEVPGFLPWSER